jgi:cysteine desulfurase
MRAGTENLYGVVGFAKALELAITHLETDRAHILSLKSYLMQRLQELGDVRFNGDADGACLYTVLNVSFPRTETTEMLLMNLDMKGICVSGGSACSSGADMGSHVIRAVAPGVDRVPIRFSFCKHNTNAELDQLVETLKDSL